MKTENSNNTFDIIIDDSFSIHKDNFFSNSDLFPDTERYHTFLLEEISKRINNKQYDDIVCYFNSLNDGLVYEAVLSKDSFHTSLGACLEYFVKTEQYLLAKECKELLEIKIE
jgi:hypothetical protein